MISGLEALDEGSGWRAVFAGRGKLAVLSLQLAQLGQAESISDVDGSIWSIMVTLSNAKS